MKSLLHDRIQQLLNDAIAFNSNDNLVHVDTSDSKLIQFHESMVFKEDEVPKKLVKEVRVEIKEKGVNPLCLIQGLVELQFRGKTHQTPILLTPVSLHHDKVRSQFRFSLADELFVNPFLIRTLLIEFELDASSVDAHNLLHWLAEKGFSVMEDLSFIGSFHHHRFAIVKELEELLNVESYSESLLQLFGELEMESESWNIESSNLLTADIDHELVFDLVRQSNTVVQGPPGTGKTQVLVNIIGKMIQDRKRLTVVSEKHVALEVVFSKLNTLGLSPLAYIAASEHSNTSFIRSLEESWKFFEELEIKEPINLKVSEQLEHKLQLILETVNKEKLAGGISYSSFLKLFRPFKNNSYTYRSAIPELTEFEKYSTTIKEIYENQLGTSVGILKPIAVEQRQLSTLDLKITEWQNNLSALQTYFQILYWSDLEYAMKTAADLQIFENELVKKYSSLLEPNSSNRRKFERLFKKWISHPLREHPLAIPSHWISRPSILELEDLNERLSGSFFVKRKAIKRWKQLSHLPVQKAKEAIAEEALIRKQEDSLTQLNVKFCELGVESPTFEVEQIKHLLQYLTPEKWSVYEQFSAKERLEFQSFHSKLRTLYDDLNSHLNPNLKKPLQDQLDQLKKDLGKIIETDTISNLSDHILKLIGECKTWEDFQADLFHSHKIQLESTYPTLRGFDPEQIGDHLNEIIELQKNETELFVQGILFNKKRQFEYYQQLLTTPARKLSETDKAFKQELKRGKSILVKEFGKSRQHLSLRELFSTEARHWIQLLKPIWLSNPTSLAKSLPLDQELFDICIFDESTQIPLQNALGILQRSKRAVVAGDEHQMGPSNYFNASGTETEDLLHQASYHYLSSGLHHHYRSKYPDLIKFSNKHFYQNKLLVYPSPYQPEDVINYQYVSTGRFINRSNIDEAKAVAKEIATALNGKHKTGVVAFSEEQLGTILSQLTDEQRNVIEEKIENEGWFCKALENLQGDECDHIIISFGYAPNEEGEFHHRFGPMNLPTGRNRLNVLMTRAREKMTLYSSVKSSDFKVSENESVNMLRQFLAYFEKHEASNIREFPYELKPELNKLDLTFDQIYDKFTNARELVTLHNVLKQRGWKVNYR